LVKNLINEETWTGVDADIKGDAYEGLLEKNAADTKSGAGQYFTPRALIKAMVDVMRPIPGMVIADPACGTGGFLLASHDYITEHHQLDRDQKLFLRDKTFRGTEIVPNTARLCAMNLFLHGIGGADINADPPVRITDSLLQAPNETVDMVLANPPFGRKSSVTMVGSDGKVAKEDQEIAREDFWATTANKQLNFVQHIRSMVKIGGAVAVVLPDNVLFEAGAGEVIRRALLHECNVHTMLRLPTGIFYSQGVKANVLFFERRAASKDPATKDLWVYDFRTNQNFTLKTRQMKRHHLDDFIAAYKAGARHERVEAENFKRYRYEELAARQGFNLDVWADVVDDSLTDPSTLPPPEVIAQQIVEEARAGIEAFEAIAAELAEIAAANGDEIEEDPVDALLHPDDD
jgi:type I restriction enzyme M protein